MKKFIIILIFVLLLIIILIVCNNENKSNYSLEEEFKKVDYFIIQHKDISVKVDYDKEVDLICEMLSGKIDRKRKLDNSKGWIYKITAFDVDGNELKTIFILDENNIRIKNKSYENKNIDIKIIDEITSINIERKQEEEK